MRTSRVYTLARETKTKVIKVSASVAALTALVGVAFPAFIGTPTLASSSSVCADTSVCTYATLAQALASNDPVITLKEDVLLSGPIIINRAVEIDGQGHHLSATFSKTDTEDNALIKVSNSDKTIRLHNMILDGTRGTNLHGVNAYRSSGLTLDTLTVTNFLSGVVVNGSTVTIRDITTSGNRWHAINVDKAGAILTIDGTSRHAEPLLTPHIFVDDTSLGVVIHDVAEQYAVQSVPYEGHTANVYRARPATPTNPRWVVAGQSLECNQTTTINKVTPTWDAVSGAQRYDYSYKSPSMADWSAAEPFSGTSILDQAFGAAGVNKGTVGTWQFRIRSVDIAGVTSAWSKACPLTYTLDTTGPTVTITSPTADTVRGSVTIAGQSNEELMRYYLVILDRTGAVVAGSPGVVTQPTIANYIWDTTRVADGSYTIQLEGRDVAGNKDTTLSIAKKVVKVDNTVPVIPTALFSALPDGTSIPDNGTTTAPNFRFAVSSSADTTRYQLRYWNAIDSSPYKQTSPWAPSDLSHTGHMATLGTYTDTFTQGEGVHYFSFSACDNAGNCSNFSAPFTVKYLVRMPTVAAENFNTFDSGGYKGISVGFNLANFTTVTGVTVDLYSDETLLATNTHSQKLLNLIASGALQFSSPFITVNDGSYTEEYWNLGAVSSLTTATKPTRTVITVIGTNIFGDAASASATNTAFYEGAPSWPTYSSILPLPPPPPSPNVVLSVSTPGSSITITTTTANGVTQRVLRVNTRQANVVVTRNQQPAPNIVPPSPAPSAVLGATDTPSAPTKQLVPSPTYAAANPAKKAGALSPFVLLALVPLAASILWFIAVMRRRKTAAEVIQPTAQRLK